jgi:lysophospholipase L1-like esterase
MFFAAPACLWLMGCGGSVPGLLPVGAAPSGSGTVTAGASPVLPVLPPPVEVPVSSPLISTWSRTWESGLAQMPDGTASVSGMTVRQFMHTSIGGDTVEITFSNVLGAQPLVISASHLALRDTKAAIVAGTDHALTFGGAGSVTVAAGAVVVSDPLTMTVQPFADLAVTTFFGSTPVVMTGNPYPIATSYVVAGNEMGSVDLGTAGAMVDTYYLAAADVSSASPAVQTTVVGFGDSVMDGNGSTIDGNHRWLDGLAQRLAGTGKGVANAGIVGNRLLHGAEEPVIFYGDSGVSRFGRDALAAPAVQDIIVSIGLNDIGATENGAAPQSEKVTADDLIAGYTTLIQQAHAKNVRVLGATLTPIAGFYGFTSADETTRQTINVWLRSGKSGYDGVIDFDAVVRDPAKPAQLASQYDSGDGIHPNDAGYAVMAGAIDLSTL